METITHAQVQELANKLPETKLSLAFHFCKTSLTMTRTGCLKRILRAFPLMNVAEF